MGDDTPLAVLSESAAPLLQLLPSALRPGDEPADRPAARAAGDVARHLRRRARRACWRRAEAHARSSSVPRPCCWHTISSACATLGPSRRRLRTASRCTRSSRPPRDRTGWRAALDALCAAAVEAVDAGATMLILSDRGVDAEHAPIPMLLAVGAVHHHLIRDGMRMAADLVAETGEAWDIHHFAVPDRLRRERGASLRSRSRRPAPSSRPRLRRSCRSRQAAEVSRRGRGGLLKIMSKMGISTLSSYRGAPDLRGVGLDQALVDRCFAGTPSPHRRHSACTEIGAEVLRRHGEAFAGRPRQRAAPITASSASAARASTTPTARRR